MIRSHMLGVVTGITVGIVVGLSSRPAFAIKQFSDQFKAMYVKPESTDPNEKALAAEFETAKCNVCHVGKNKKERNTYGEALADLLQHAGQGLAAFTVFLRTVRAEEGRVEPSAFFGQ